MSTKQKKSRSEQKHKDQSVPIEPHTPQLEPHGVKLGVCAMKKKIYAKPMQQILKKISCKYIQIVIIDNQYWDKHYKTWPKVDALICFYSDGFPYMKAWKYVEYTKPFLINDLDKQQLLWDRSLIYSQLKKNGIPVSNHIFVCRNRETVSQFYKKRNSDMGYADEKLYPAKDNRISEKTKSNEQQIEVQLEQIKSVKSSLKREQRISKNSNQLSPKKTNRDSMFEIDTIQNPSTNRLEQMINKKSELLKNLYFQKQESSHRRKNNQQLQIRNPATILKSYFENQVYENYQVIEKQDQIIIGDVVFKKPLVEKPFDAEDHQVCIYYPERDGGGRKILFRKKENCSSSFEQNVNKIRTQGNYIYEQFLRTNGFDIKVYTVGPYYMHAQARKAPSLDGVVQRNQNGKQIRYPVTLTPAEKAIARKIVIAFKQNVCGFDLLRSNGKSYVCDVNGWSFVKQNHKYYDDCAAILRKTILEKFMPYKVKQLQSEIMEINALAKNIPLAPSLEMKPNNVNNQQLRSIVSILRHGDRNPKQKMKLQINDPRILAFFGNSIKQVKIKDPITLALLLDTTNEILKQTNFQMKQYFLKLVQLKSVLEIGGHFEGLNRKIQLRPIDKSQSETGKVVVTNALLILKWGGQLTKQGEHDAQQLGKFFRLTKYPEEGLISLHSSYKHDLKTYSSEEGRCLNTAAAFLKGFLDLQGQLTPIINSMVNRQEKAQFLLDLGKQQGECQTESQRREKEILENLLNSKQPLINGLSKHFNLGSIPRKMIEIINKLQNPRLCLQSLLQSIKELTSEIQEIIHLKQSSYYINPQDAKSHSKIEPQSESLTLMYKRWYKLQKDLYDAKSDRFNISKIPDVFGSINYDINHNKSVLQKIYKNYTTLFDNAQLLAHFVVPNQYGIETETKLDTAKAIVAPLCQKILNDLLFWKGEKNSEEEQFWKYTRHVRTRLYFTSSSHIYSIYHLLTLGNKGQLLDSCEKQVMEKVKNITYIGYLAHINLCLYENVSVNLKNPKRFRLQLSFSPKYGTKQPALNQKLMLAHSQFTIDEIQTFFKTVLAKKWQN